MRKWPYTLNEKFIYLLLFNYHFVTHGWTLCAGFVSSYSVIFYIHLKYLNLNNEGIEGQNLLK